MECVQRIIVVDAREEARLSRARASSLDDEPDGRRLVVDDRSQCVRND